MITKQEAYVLSQIDSEETIRWVQELTRIPSVWHPETNIGEEAAASWVAEQCQAIGLDTTVEIVTPGRPNVIAILEGKNEEAHRPTLMFEGHTDVVTEGDPELWTDPPFSATLRNGRIYGRGANDMKAGLVCALQAIKALAKSGVPLRGDVLLGAVCDEEGDMLGIKHFVDQGWADRVDAAIICEPEENHLCIAQKGVMWMRATIHGIMSHGAMPLSGVNSAYPLAHFLTLVHSLEEREIARHGCHELLGQPSITPTIVRSPLAGEPQKNVMPGGAEAILDFRLIPGQDPVWLARQVEKMLAAVTASDERLNYTIETLEVRHPTHTDREEPIVTTLADTYQDVTGQAPIYGGVPGSTDGTILHAFAGIPIVTCGPGDIHMPHQIDEWVSTAEVETAVQLYALAAMRYLGIHE